MDYEKDILVSIIMPVYNVGEYLKDCLDSVINQTYTNMEIICVNDGSTDNSLEILKEYKNKDSRIVIIDKANGGLVSARKAGVEAAKGEYSIHIDSDDWIELNMIEELVNKVRKTNADIVTSGLVREFGKGSILETDNIEEGFYSKDSLLKDVIPKMMYTGCFYETGINIHVFNKLIKTGLLKKMQPRIDDFIKVGEDAAVVYPCILNAESICVTHKIYYHYRFRTGSIMGVSKGNDIERLKMLEKHLDREIDEFIQSHNIKDDSLKENLRSQKNAVITYLMIMREPMGIIRINRDGSIYPFDNLKLGDDVVLFGAGRVGVSIHDAITEHKLCNIKTWVDNSVNGEGIVTLKEFLVSETDYDKIIVAATNAANLKSMYQELIENGIDRNKISQIKP